MVGKFYDGSSLGWSCSTLFLFSGYVGVYMSVHVGKRMSKCVDALFLEVFEGFAVV